MDEQTRAALEALAAELNACVMRGDAGHLAIQVTSWQVALESLAKWGPVQGIALPKETPPCVHHWAALDYWRDLGTVTLFCVHCAVVKKVAAPAEPMQAAHD